MKIGSALVLILFCGVALAGGAMAQDDHAQQAKEACMNDAMTVCSQFIPDRQRVAGCLISNRSRISQPCRMALMHWR